jgi:hypothetical protein
MPGKGVDKLDKVRLRKMLEDLIRAQQANIDHISGEASIQAREFNKLAQDVDFIFTLLGVDQGALGGNEDSDPSVPSNLVHDHDDLDGVSANQHHNQSHTQADHDAAEAGDLSSIDIGDAAAAGSSTEVPNADHQHAYTAPTTGYPVDVAATEADGSATTPARSDHRHAHGTGYAGGHSDYPDLAAHLADSSDAHDASAVSIADAGGNFAATEVEAALAELASGTGAGAHDHDEDDLIPDQITTDELVSTPGLSLAPAAASDAFGSASIEDDYLPPGYAFQSVWLIEADAGGDDTTFTGFAETAAGRCIAVINTAVAGSGNLLFEHQDSGSGGTHQFRLPGDETMTIAPGEGAVFWYDDGPNDWRVMARVGGGGGSLELEDDTVSAASDVTIIDFGPGLSVTDDGSGHATVDIEDPGTVNKTVWVPADVFTLDDATRTNLGDDGTELLNALIMDGTTRQGAHFNALVPDDWASGNIAATIVWRKQNTNAGDVRFVVSTTLIAAGDAVTENTSGTAVVVSPGGISTVLYSAVGDVITPAATGILFKFNVERTPADAADTYADNAHVLGVILTYTADAAPGTGGGAGSATIVVQEEDVTVVAAADTIDFGDGFDVTATGSEANIALDLSEKELTDLGDVDTSSVVIGSSLIWDGSAWVADDGPSGHWFGDGSDGVIDLDGTNTFAGLFTTTGAAPNLSYEIARTVFATLLTVRSGISVFVGGDSSAGNVPNYPIYASTGIVVESTGIIKAPGDNAVTSSAGTGSTAGEFGGTSAGGNGRSTAGAGSAAGNQTGTPSFGTSGALSSKGGAGGTAGANAGGAAGTVANVAATRGGVYFARQAAKWQAGGGAAGATFSSGTGGGGGGVGATIATSGGGGASGGIIYLAARYVANSGSIIAAGGNGAAASSTTGNAGGGGGGGGGIIVVHCRKYSGSLPTAPGGTGGNGSNVGAGDVTRAGADGSTGPVVIM